MVCSLICLEEFRSLLDLHTIHHPWMLLDLLALVFSVKCCSRTREFLGVTQHLYRQAQRARVQATKTIPYHTMSPTSLFGEIQIWLGFPKCRPPSVSWWFFPVSLQLLQYCWSGWVAGSTDNKAKLIPTLLSWRLGLAWQYHTFPHIPWSMVKAEHANRQEFWTL